MSWFQRMNRKIDEGWKMTTMSCDCKASLLIFMENRNLYCPKCDKISSDQVILELDTHEQTVPQSNTSSESKPIVIDKENSKDYDSDDFDLEEQMKDFNSRLYVNKEKADEASKKIGQLLLSGWAMLNESCLECLQPIMKSKQGVRLCVQCNREEKPDQPKQKPSEQQQQQLPVQQQQLIIPKVPAEKATQVQVEKKQQIIFPQSIEQTKKENKLIGEQIVASQLIRYYDAVKQQLLDYDEKNLILLSKTIATTEKELAKSLTSNQLLAEARIDCLKEVGQYHEKCMNLKQFDRAVKVMNIIVMINDIMQKL